MRIYQTKKSPHSDRMYSFYIDQLGVVTVLDCDQVIVPGCLVTSSDIYGYYDKLVYSV